MKAALVVHDFDRGFGHGRYTVELATRLAPRHDVHVLANRFAVAPPPDVTLERVRAWRAAALTTIPTFVLGAECRLARTRWDIVHSQGLASWRADVVTAHICNAARKQHGHGSRGREAFFHLFVDWLEEAFYRQNRPRHLIAISRRVANEIQSLYGWEKPVTVIYHGVDASQFHPLEDPADRPALRQSLGVRDGAWTWLFVGEATKGLSEVLATLPYFLAAQLLVVSRSVSTAYLDLARRLGVDARVNWLGPQGDPARVYRAADVLVYPSAYDAFGMVVAEAMASGLPVVVGQDIGAAEWVKDGENGLLCDPAKPETLRQALARLTNEAGLARQLGLAARQTAMAHDWADCAVRTEAVYQQVLEERRRA